MKKKLLFITALFSALFAGEIYSQTTITTNGSPVWWGTDAGLVFGVHNTNAFPLILTEIGNHIPASSTNTYSLWYNTTTVAGAPGPVTAVNGWTEVPGTVTITGSTTAGIVPIFTGLSIVIPANTTYRIAIGCVGSGPYYASSGSSATSFSGGGVDILTQSNTLSPTYVGYFPNDLINTPRGFLGYITMDVPVGINSSEIVNSGLVIYPNPSNGSVTIASDKKADYTLVNTLGQTVKIIALNSGNNFKTEVNGLSSGVYFLVGIGENNIPIYEKIVVTK